MIDLETLPVPLHRDSAGAIRVGSGRVLLEVVARAFRGGRTAEEISSAFDSVSLAEVYAVLAWCLANPDDLDRYLAQVEGESERIRAEASLGHPTGARIREQLEARRRGTEA